MAMLATMMCWLCGCHVSAEPQPVDNLTVTVIPHGTTGTFLAISGKGFSDRTGENIVTIGNDEAQVVSATPKRLIVKAPDSLRGTVPVTVTVKDQSSNVVYLHYPGVGVLADAMRP